MGHRQRRHDRSSAGGVDDAASAGRDHGSSCVLDTQEYAHHVYGQHFLDVTSLDVGERAVARDGTGVVEHDVEPAVRLDGGLHGSLDVCFVGDVATDEGSDPAVGADVVADLSAFVVLDVGHDDLGAVASEQSGGALADAACAARDDRHLPLQSATETNSRYKHERMEETSTRKGSYRLVEEESTREIVMASSERKLQIRSCNF